jgi:hypothetical protein
MRTIVTLALLAVATPDDKLARYMRVFGVKLERNTLDDVVKRLGPAKIQFNGGDAHAGQYSVCYQGEDGTMLVFSSHAEMGGSSHDLTGLQLLIGPEFADYGGDERYEVPPEGKPACAPLAALNRSIALGGTLRVGETRRSIARTLGVPLHKRDAISASASVPAGKDFETWRTVEVVFQHGRAAAIRASRITSN